MPEYLGGQLRKMPCDQRRRHDTRIVVILGDDGGEARFRRFARQLEMSRLRGAIEGPLWTCGSMAPTRRSSIRSAAMGRMAAEVKDRSFMIYGFRGMKSARILLAACRIRPWSDETMKLGAELLERGRFAALAAIMHIGFPAA